MMIELNCECGAHLRFSVEHAGKHDKCPGCGRVLLIPTPVASPSTPDKPPAGTPKPLVSKLADPSQTVHRETKPSSTGPPPLPTSREGPPLPGSEPPGDQVGQAPLVEEVLLSQDNLNQLRAAVRFWRQMRRVSISAWVMFALTCSVVVISILLYLEPANKTSLTVMLIVWLVCGGLCVLFYVIPRATMQCKRWAPMIMLVFFSILVACFTCALIVDSLTTKQSVSLSEQLTSFLGLFAPALVAFLAYRGFTSIPGFLRQPAWCRHVLTAKVSSLDIALRDPSTGAVIDRKYVLAQLRDESPSTPISSLRFVGAVGLALATAASFLVVKGALLKSSPKRSPLRFHESLVSKDWVSTHEESLNVIPVLLPALILGSLFLHILLRWRKGTSILELPIVRYLKVHLVYACVLAWEVFVVTEIARVQADTARWFTVARGSALVAIGLALGSVLLARGWIDAVGWALIGGVIGYLWLQPMSFVLFTH